MRLRTLHRVVCVAVSSGLGT